MLKLHSGNMPWARRSPLLMRVKFGIYMYISLLAAGSAFAQTPLIRDQFTADPTARVFKGRVYVYSSHDVHCGTDWFCMKDYHVFSSENLVDWTDHGMIVAQEKVAWVDAPKNSMWASPYPIRPMALR